MVNVTEPPSLTEAAERVNVYVGVGVVDVSLMVTLTVWLLDVKVIVSEPSVVVSEVILSVTLAVLPLIVKLPVKLAPPISLDVMPVIVYGISVPSATLVVVIVKVTDPPSLTDATELVSKYLGGGGMVASACGLFLESTLATDTNDVSRALGVIPKYRCMRDVTCLSTGISAI
jgi:hypothetical protein